jgi:hypothetical protein
MTASAESLLTTRGPRHRVPDFFIVGHPKSGTTALYAMLKRHPQVYLPSFKEPWFLASELSAYRALRPPRHGKTPETLEEYLSLFDPATPEQRVGEASALYLWSHTAAGRIAELQPAARIIAVLREPASFLRSLHFQFVQTYTETEKDLGKAISLENVRREGRHIPRDTYWPDAVLYSEHVRYVEQLRRYEALFPPEQLLVLIYDDFRNDNEATVRKVLRFLDVDATAPIAAVERNPTVRVRSPRLYELLHAVASGEGPIPRAMRATVKRLAPRRMNVHSAVALRDRVLYAKPKPPDERLMVELRRRFKPEVVALSEHLDRDLVTLWGYDRID